MIEVSRKTDLPVTKADLITTTADLRAAFERQTERLTLTLGGMLIVGFAVMGFLIFAVGPFVVP